MSESVVHWATLAGGIVVQVVIAAFFYGKVTEQVTGTKTGLIVEVNDRKEDVARIDDEQGDQWKEINTTAKSIEKIKGHLGVNGV